jgi:ferredoxin
MKEAVFPKTERLYGYRVRGRQVELVDEPAPDRARIVVGARPCDAAALSALDLLFGWDTVDEFYAARRAATTVLTVACREHDEHCFCTSVGLGPADARGSDALLKETEPGVFHVQSLTAKGAALFAGAEEAGEDGGYAGPPKRFEVGAVRQWLAGHFESPVWTREALRCLGCGACASVCPTCHCFDIVDEHGARVRNWDSCQHGLFTLHASGHNPRQAQAQRQRQRLMHKFEIFPSRFGPLLCTGCGNCTRACPADLGVLSLLKAVEHEQHLQA